MKKQVQVDDKEITVIGTAHISEKSRKEVKETIEEINPDYVGVELDQDRYNSLTGDSRWKELDMIEAFKQGKGYLLLLNVLLSIYQRKLGLEKGVTPGQELLEAINIAEEKKIRYGLIDRNINETLERLRAELTFWEKIKLMSNLMVIGEEEELDVEKLKEDSMIDGLVKELEKEFPSVNKVFLEERNQYMAEEILKEEFNKAVVVVGAAHVEGLIKELKEKKKYQVEEKTSKIPVFKIIKYGLPALVLGMMAYGYQIGGLATLYELGTVWIMLNVIFTFIGAVIARSHPLTCIGASLSSPITSLIPVIGAGFVAVYIESIVRPPTVEETENITELTSYKQLWENQVGVLLLTFVLVSLGSAIATFTGAGLIATILSAL